MLRAQSLCEISNIYSNKLGALHDKIEKNNKKTEAKIKEGKTGVDAYFVEDSDDSDDSFEDAKDEGAKTMMNSDASDPSKLIDLELVNLLRYCYNLLEQRETEAY